MTVDILRIKLNQNHEEKMNDNGRKNISQTAMCFVDLCISKCFAYAHINVNKL